jgi:catechol 2,3-dioxygenase-like lactoylglutathione lyase family enzyme
MKRMHIHISVDDLDANIQFYTGLFNVAPSVIKPDYAKWMLEDPRINFAISMRHAPAGLNHLGIQVESEAELSEMHTRLQTLERQTEAQLKPEPGAACCYAKSDKYWITDPQGVPWETYHTLEAIPVFGAQAEANAQNECCVPLTMIGRAKKSAESSPPSSGCCG